MQDFMRSMIITVGLLAATAPAVAGDGKSSHDAVDPGIWALEYGVQDLERAVAFYEGALGFVIESRDSTGSQVQILNGSVRLVLRRTPSPTARPGSARAYLNMSVGEIEASLTKVRAHGGEVAWTEPEVSAVGPFMEVHDPAGHPIHLINHPWDEMTEESAPKVFNLGLAVRSLKESEEFLTNLGFKVATRDYLPKTLVFEPQGIGYLVVHPEAEFEADTRAATGSLILISRSPEAGDGEIDLRRSPSGILMKLASRKTLEGAAGMARATFGRLKDLQGQWRASSTKGWSEVISYEVTARGSVVVGTTRFQDSPESTMHSMYHLDGDRLMVTHYCEAGNQPRLVADAFEEDGTKVTFSFLDGANIPTRDIGHMDKAVFNFMGRDRFSSQWTWYQDGKEEWMEEILYERIR